MRIRVNKSVPNGVFTASPSKSHTHRLLIIAAFTPGKTIINNLEYCDDIEATINCLRSLGCNIKLNNSVAEIIGISADYVNPINILDCKESASSLRMLLPLCLLFNKTVSFTGSSRLFERTHNDIDCFLRSTGSDFQFKNNTLSIKGNLKSGEYYLDCSSSSQLFSGILIALSLLGGNSTVISGNETVSRPYIELTKNVLCDFGYNCNFENNIAEINDNNILPVRHFTVEGDWSGAVNFILLKQFGNVTINGLNNNSCQPDKQAEEYIGKLKNGECEIDITHCPDIAPVLFCAASLFHGGHFSGVSRLVNKESNRLETMITELNKFGVECIVDGDKLSIFNSRFNLPSAMLDSHGDHRIAMALTTLLSITGGELDNAECVSKSMPDYYKKMKEISIGITEL